MNEWLEETKQLLDDIRNTLEADPAAGRQTLRRLLAKPIVLTPVPDGFDFDGEASFMRFDHDTGTVQPISQRLTGQIARRVQQWCPRTGM